jgi:hypothetical protein
MLIAANDSATIAQIKGEFSRRFEMKDLGKVSVCLGLEIHRNRADRILHLSQNSYIDTVLERFGMQNRKPVATPMETSNSKTIFPGDQDPADDVLYLQAVGSLMYLMVGPRRDLALMVGKLSKFCEKPLKSHWTAVKRVLRYICGTRDRGIKYGTSHSLWAQHRATDFHHDQNHSGEVALPLLPIMHCCRSRRDHHRAADFATGHIIAAEFFNIISMPPTASILELWAASSGEFCAVHFHH